MHGKVLQKDCLAEVVSAAMRYFLDHSDSFMWCNHTKHHDEDAERQDGEAITSHLDL